jgi:putative ATP-binding cassette transporter
MRPKATGATDPSRRARSWLEFFRLFLALAGSYWREERRWRARGLSLLLALLTAAQVIVPISLNLWNQNLFDALEKRSMGRFALILAALSLIIIADMAITTAHLRVKRWLQIDWREWLTGEIEGEWMAAGRHYQLSQIPGEHDNPDGRIAEDIRIATENAIDLAHSLLYCVLLLVSFTQILWSLSRSPEIVIGGIRLWIPGYLVWLAFAHAAVGTGVAMLLGRPLVRATDRRQSFEADYRFGLMHARENSLAIALVHGEADERRQFSSLFRGALDAWHTQTRALTNIMLYTSSWSVFSQAFPLLVAAPRYITGAITLGTLMQTVQGFQQMITALSWPVDNLAILAAWRASVERVLGLHQGVADLVEHVSLPARETISVTPGPGASLAFRGVSIASPAGEIAIPSFDLEFLAGDHVLITGHPGGADMIFKAAAGLWPWGRGRIELPERAIFFMTQRPYLPAGTLRHAISYPDLSQPGDGRRLLAALKQVGLEPLAARLDESENWERVLPIDEQQRLGFARLLLQRPAWIFIQNAMDGLDQKGQEDMVALLRREFAEATVITVLHRPGPDGFYRRKLLLEEVGGVIYLRELELLQRSL